MKKPRSIMIMSIIAIIFGVATIKEGGAVLFTDEGRVAAGKSRSICSLV